MSFTQNLFNIYIWIQLDVHYIKDIDYLMYEVSLVSLKLLGNDDNNRQIMIAQIHLG